jgi:hypothetical protein
VGPELFVFFQVGKTLFSFCNSIAYPCGFKDDDLQIINLYCNSSITKMKVPSRMSLARDLNYFTENEKQFFINSLL